jgi:hypothetical protein
MAWRSEGKASDHPIFISSVSHLSVLKEVETAVLDNVISVDLRVLIPAM